MAQSQSECRICEELISNERLVRWPWAVTCSPTCADQNAAEIGRQARRRYRRRRRQAAARRKRGDEQG